MTVRSVMQVLIVKKALIVLLLVKLVISVHLVYKYLLITTLYITPVPINCC